MQIRTLPAREPPLNGSPSRFGRKRSSFLGNADAMVKLRESMPEARSRAAEEPGRYKAWTPGWVKVRFQEGAPEVSLLNRRIKESYRTLSAPRPAASPGTADKPGQASAKRARPHRGHPAHRRADRTRLQDRRGRTAVLPSAPSYRDRDAPDLQVRHLCMVDSSGTLNEATRQGVGFSLSPGFFCSTEQAFDIQVETPSLGRIHPWSKSQTTMNATTPINSFMTVLFAPMNFIPQTVRSPFPFRRSYGSRC
jgi:hypothetical protein